MKLQVMSDLHIESLRGNLLIGGPPPGFFEVPEGGDHPDLLILAGDITNWTRKEELRRLMNRHPLSGTNITYVLGNHEYYRCPGVEEAREAYATEFRDDDGRIRLLDSSHFELETESGEKAVIIGTTLWTDITNPIDEFYVTGGLNDFSMRGLTPDWYKEQHQLAVEYISDTLVEYENYPGKKIVVTHHCPSFKSSHPRYAGSRINAGFCSELDHLFGWPFSPDLWIHGHTHDSYDYMIGNTRIVCNPKGYSYAKLDSSGNPVYENSNGFKPTLILEI